jgi:hypothetical protein
MSSLRNNLKPKSKIKVEYFRGHRGDVALQQVFEQALI